MTTLCRTLFAVLLLMLGVGSAVVHAAVRDRLTIALQLEPPTLDPTSGAAVAVDEVVYATVFEGLVRLDGRGQVQPLLAARWDVSPDGLDYVFHLRPDVRFHDGARLTADDVAFSLGRAIAPGSTNAQAVALRAIERVRVIDPLTVAIRLKARDSGFLTLLSLGDAVIVSHRSAAALATAPVGTGPYRFDRWRRGDQIDLVRNPAYWGTPAQVGRVSFRFIADPTAAFAAMRAHDVDIFPDFPAPETLDQLRADPALKVVIGPTEGEVLLAFNQRSGPLADVRVRRAITRAIDRAAIINGAMYGHGTPIGSHFPPQSPDYIDLTGVNPHNVAGAKRLLADAGYPQGFALTLKLPPPSYARRAGEIIAAQLGAVGIRVSIQNLEWAQWLDQVFTRHQFDMTIVSHAEPFDYDIYARPGYYFGQDPAPYQALMAQLRAATGQDARHQVLAAIQRRLADDAINAWLFEFPRLGVQRADLNSIWANTPNQTLSIAAAQFSGAAVDSSVRPAARGTSTGHWLLGWVLILGLGLLVDRAGRAYGWGFLARRAAVMAITLLAASALIFVLVQVVPGDPAAYMMGMNASPDAVAALHRELGLEGPAITRYGHWLGGMLTGDFGTSYTYRVPVAGLLVERLALSLPLALIATVLSILVGVPLGYASVRWAGRWVEPVSDWLARIGVAMPNFWLGILLILLFSVSLGWVGAGGFPGWMAGIGPALAALALPSIALALPQAAILARITRATLGEAMAQDYVRTARAKGLSRAQALARHALPNAIGPVLTVLGLQVPFLLAGSAIIENVFSLPGLGRLALQAIAQRDLIVVQAVVMLMVAITVLASFIVDLVYPLVDPRLRERAA